MPKDKDFMLFIIVMSIMILCFIGFASYGTYEYGERNGKEEGAKEALIDHTYAVQTSTITTYKGNILTKKEVVKVNPYK